MLTCSQPFARLSHQMRTWETVNERNKSLRYLYCQPLCLIGYACFGAAGVHDLGKQINMTGSNNTADLLGPFQQAIQEHSSVHTLIGSRGRTDKTSRPRSAAKQAVVSKPTADPQNTLEPSSPRLCLPVKKSPEPCAASGRVAPRHSPDVMPSQAVLVAPGTLPLARMTTSSSAATNEKLDPTQPPDSSVTPPPQRAPLRAAATRSKSPVRKAKDVGPFQASASLFHKKAKLPKPSKSRSQHSSSQPHPSARNREHRSKRGGDTAQHVVDQIPAPVPDVQQPARRHLAGPVPAEAVVSTAEDSEPSPAVGLENLVPALPLQGMSSTLTSVHECSTVCTRC